MRGFSLPTARDLFQVSVLWLLQCTAHGSVQFIYMRFVKRTWMTWACAKTSYKEETWKNIQLSAVRLLVIGRPKVMPTFERANTAPQWSQGWSSFSKIQLIHADSRGCEVLWSHLGAQSRQLHHLDQPSSPEAPVGPGYRSMDVIISSRPPYRILANFKHPLKSAEGISFG